MCIAAWIWQAHPVHQLLLLLNRDEFHSRPTKAVGWWGEGSKKILGGRDVLGGGTWMGCTKDGRLAFLTNVLEPDAMPGARTRGDLPLRFLQSNKSPLEVATEVAEEAHEYNGFNLILADLTTNIMVYVSNRPKGQPATIQLVSPGLHVLSNARLDSPWQKAIRLGKNFRELLREHGGDEIEVKDIVERLMTDTTKADKDRLPKTGCDPNWEHGLSSIFIEVQTDQGLYGTRSTAVLSVNYDGEASLYEKYLESGIWKDHTVNYQIE
ncbi:hypothetical protein BDA96_10G353200 [Sorghum bicolor]|uniref:Uncharacterized protein n=2 Tax=Sorghum bicolor TaxID=4558 RepID=A0A921Q8Q3_SORBI|nr:transport and Golgi organization 2 homolog [Sorghum bicolor]KAG0516335.1 hypothetical protein BDA96_10G353200 [Sorghum bicolor]KXG20954.1 hypothetical protein SORBI_3010G275100 [Sorghum bicolor]|eukprot:XP_021305937.1 transport and Golgi organization 2 homolog [Sorghum bicolor]